MEKQYTMYPGTRKKISLHPRNGSYPLGDAYATSVLPCFHANMLSLLTEKARPFIWYFSIWPRGFLSSSVVTVPRSARCAPWRLSRAVCRSHSLVTPLLFVYSLHFG